MSRQMGQQVSASEVAREFESRINPPIYNQYSEELHYDDKSIVCLWTQNVGGENYAIFRQHRSKDINETIKIGEWHGWELTRDAYRTIFEQHANPSAPVPFHSEIIILTREEDGKYVLSVGNGLWSVGNTREEALQALEEERKELALYMKGPVERVCP